VWTRTSRDDCYPSAALPKRLAANSQRGGDRTAPISSQLPAGPVVRRVGLDPSLRRDVLCRVDSNWGDVDGDQLSTDIARARKEAGTLKGTVVGTVMTHSGSQVVLPGKRERVMRADGGRIVTSSPCRGQTAEQLGGRASGHFSSLDKSTTGVRYGQRCRLLGVMKGPGAHWLNLL